jgi:hypothetical protein
MLSDPLSVTYNGSAKSLPARGSFEPRAGKLIASRAYGTADNEFGVVTSSWLLPAGVTRSEIILTRVTPDSDSDPFNGNWRELPNSVGLVFEANSFRYATSVDIPLLRTALLSLVDSSFQAKLISGEL